MGGVADAQAVVGECAVLVYVGSNIDVAVVEVVVREIPISSAIVSKTTQIESNESTHVLSKPIPWVRI